MKIKKWEYEEDKAQEKGEEEFRKENQDEEKTIMKIEKKTMINKSLKNEDIKIRR